MCLIEGQALIKWQGGIFSKFNKRAGSNKEAGWNIFSNLIGGRRDLFLIKGHDGNSINEQNRNGKSINIPSNFQSVLHTMSIYCDILGNRF